MNLDAHAKRAQELALTLGVRSPRVKRGKLSESLLPEGIWTRTAVYRPYIAITPAFGNLTTAEQDSELAQAVVLADLIESGTPKLLCIASIGSVASIALAGFVTTALDVPARLWAEVAITLFVGLYLGMYLVHMLSWTRRMFYQADRRIAEVLGAPAVTTSVQVSRRMRYKRRGLFGLWIGLSMPNEGRRLDAIADLAPVS
ncbi:hypothetical protein ACFWM1_32320 [Nocardia sp. NPDC058379]|uniref:hypothetical protein n=1 Tax=unclassified Nocardia TaxID=2637762 RepID=UPI0036529654